MKGLIQPAHISKNNFLLQVIGLPVITFVQVDGLEEELETVNLPDRTVASGGNTLPVEFTAQVPAHHDAEILALEAWFKEAQDPVSPTYKKVGLLLMKNIEGKVKRTYTLTGIFAKMRATDELSLDNAGEMAIQTWTFSVDDVQPTL